MVRIYDMNFSAFTRVNSGLRHPVVLFFAILPLISACSSYASNGQEPVPDVEWTHYGGDEGGTKYSPLNQVNRTNISQLDVVWMKRLEATSEDVVAWSLSPRSSQPSDRLAATLPTSEVTPGA